LRRLVRSRVVAVAFVVVVLVLMVVMSQALGARGQERADSEGRKTAEVIVAAVVAQHLDAATSSEGLDDAELADLRGDLNRLRDEGLLLGLTVWRLDGTSAFSYGLSSGPALELDERHRELARSGGAWLSHEHASDGGKELRVFLGQSAEAAGAGAAGRSVVEVIVEHDEMTRAAESTMQKLTWALVGLFSLLGVGVLWLRARLIRRERHARQDTLTGLLNRRALYEDAPALLARATRDSPAALLLLDLAEFKSVNDTLGHAAGDDLLGQVAHALQGSLRRSDWVVRLGGDEFAVLLTDLPDAAAARTMADEIRRRLRGTPYEVSGIQLTADASIGIALSPHHGRQLAELLQRADIAMYQAKRGHGGSAVYDPTSDDHSVEQLTLVGELRQALTGEQFRLVYQPKLSLPGHRITSVEALLRWQHPTRGLLPPSEFIPTLESSGLMPAVTGWVLRHAVEQAAEWRRAGLHLDVAVNISPRSLVEQDLPARVLALLADAELPTSCLQIEITETAVMTDLERASAVLGQLHARGVGVAIDDFGAGYTSLAHLRTLPLTSLKLDRGLVTDMLDKPADQAVAQAIIELSHQLGVSVVAEGVESDALLVRLVELGCDEVQGFAVSRPLFPDALETWLRGRRTAELSAVAGSRPNPA
jgi:diguanylate cyclase (GGDEF)-like protein